MVGVIRRQLLQICLVGIILTSVTGSAIQPRLDNGQPVDTLRRFPHHVIIERILYDQVQMGLCSGSIIDEQWILTSAFCIAGSHRLRVNFQKLNLNSNENSYAAVVNSDAVHIYPTNYDDIALVKIPFRLVYSDLVRPVSISRVDISSLEGVFTVLPGFSVRSHITTTPRPTTSKIPVYTDFSANIPKSSAQSRTSSDQLTYGMFKVLSNSKCKDSNIEFDEYVQLCTESWNTGVHTPCVSDYGGGLIVGWPLNPELVGIYTVFLNDCNPSVPAIYIGIAKYAGWINSVIYG